MRPSLVAVLVLHVYLVAAAQTRPAPKAPIIDVHLHAFRADTFGKRGITECAGDNGKDWLPGDPRIGGPSTRLQSCQHPLMAPQTDKELMRQTIAILDRYNIRAVASGSAEQVQKWETAAPDRIIPALMFGLRDGVSPSAMREYFRPGGFAVLGEVVTQYEGISPSDPKLEPYLALAEELDIPVGIHMGPGPVGAAYTPGSGYRSALSNPLLLEDALVRHPKLRLYVMHAGWPMLDAMINLLYAHPQVYADLAVIDWYLPRKEFHYYLRRLIDAGFGKRLMFGSDQMLWPQAITIAIESIDSADFLTPEQKRDILYNNAEHFFRLQ